MRGKAAKVFGGVLVALASFACSSSSGDSGASGCASDNDCKGDRVCTAGQCVDRTGSAGAAGAAGGAGAAGAAGAAGSSGGAGSAGASGAAGGAGAGGAGAAVYFSDKCAQCLKPACAPQLAACKDASCSSALACVQTSKATSFNCQVDGCVGAIAAAPTANDVLLCLADKCAADCGATPGFPCQPAGAGTGTFLGASCGSCVDTSCASLANSCVADGACKTALSCVKSGLGAGKSMNCSVDGCINEIVSSPKSNDLLVCMADKCGSTCKATTGFKCP